MRAKCFSVRPLALALAAAGCLTATLPAQADERDERIQALEKRLDESLRRISQLEARQRAVEAAAPAPAAAAAVAATAAPAPTASAQDVARLQESVSQLSDSVSKLGGDTGLPVHGFGDVVGAWSGGNDPQRLRGFNAGTLDLYLTPQFGQRVKSLVEIAFEYSEEGALGVDMERLQLGYTVSDALTVWMGRFHTPFGLWNTSFHHGANLQTSIYRPRFVDFEDKGGIIPAHSVGLWASGRTDAAGGKVSFDAYLANGPSIRDRTLDFNAFSDDTSNKMLGFNVGYRPRGMLAGLSVGVHGFGSDVTAYDSAGSPTSLTRLRMGGAYFGYDADDWEAIGEYYHFSDSTVASGSAARSSNAWFVQVGKTFDVYTPFVRYERTALDPADRYFLSQASGRSYKRAALGMRYAIDPRASFKVELSHTSEEAAALIDQDGATAPFSATAYRRASVQYSVSF